MRSNDTFTSTNMRKEVILQRIREQGCRITKQRILILDTILEQECTSCKEIYYTVSRIDDKIGQATVYRTIAVLEKVGAVRRKKSSVLEYSGIDELLLAVGK